jgi:hypothetical protein
LVPVVNVSLVRRFSVQIAPVLAGTSTLRWKPGLHLDRTERRGRLGNTPSFLGGPTFKSRLGDQLS